MRPGLHGRALAFSFALLALSLGGCGGGGDARTDAPKPVIEMLGDSLTAATILPVPPAQRLRELLHDEYDVQALLTQAVGDAKKAGTVYVVGVIRSVPFELPSAATDRINREVAGAEGVPFINLRDLPFDPVTDTADSLHPSQSYSDRIMKRVADVLRAGGP